MWAGLAVRRGAGTDAAEARDVGIRSRLVGRGSKQEEGEVRQVQPEPVVNRSGETEHRRVDAVKRGEDRGVATRSNSAGDSLSGLSKVAGDRR